MTLGHVTSANGAQAISWLGGSVHRILLDSEITEGRLAMFKSTMRGGTASPVHVHANDDETVYMLSGTAVFWAGDDQWVLGPGDTIFLPRHLPHTYAITSEEAEILSVSNPSGVDAFFRAAGWDLSKPIPDGWEVDMQVLAAAGRETGQRVLGPPAVAGPGDADGVSGRSGDLRIALRRAFTVAGGRLSVPVVAVGRRSIGF